MEAIEFDWDEANVGHVARHGVTPEQAEQVIANDPIDLGLEFVEGEERFLNLGQTNSARVLMVVTAFRGERVRVVTAFPPARQLVRFYYARRGS